jgi:hypothetical protein
MFLRNEAKVAGWLSSSIFTKRSQSANPASEAGDEANFGAARVNVWRFKLSEIFSSCEMITSELWAHSAGGLVGLIYPIPVVADDPANADEWRRQRAVITGYRVRRPA